MSSSMLVYEPVAPCLTQANQSRQPLDGLAGKVIGFIDNSKPNFNLLVEDLEQILIAKHGVKRVVKRRKKSASLSKSKRGAPRSRNVSGEPGTGTMTPRKGSFANDQSKQDSRECQIAANGGGRS